MCIYYIKFTSESPQHITDSFYSIKLISHPHFPLVTNNFFVILKYIFVLCSLENVQKHRESQKSSNSITENIFIPCTNIKPNFFATIHYQEKPVGCIWKSILFLLFGYHHSIMFFYTHFLLIKIQATILNKQVTCRAIVAFQ